MADISDTPAGMVARLDDALARRGEDCLLRRTDGADKDVTVRAGVRGVRADEIVGDVTQDYSQVVISMTQILAASWPAGHVFDPAKVDPRLPRKGDSIFVKKRRREIRFVNPIAVGDIVVRVEMLVAG
ncbi:hypothetical protein [Mesorhizobium amorphae]